MGGALRIGSKIPRGNGDSFLGSGFRRPGDANDLTGVVPMVEKFPLKQAELAFAPMMSAKFRFRAMLTMGA